MTKKHKKWMAALAAVALVAAGGTALVAATLGQPPAAVYREYKVSFGDITVGVQGVGVIRLDNVPHRAEWEAKLKEMLVTPGQQVEQGQALARLDEEDLARRSKEKKAQYDKLMIQMQQLNLAQQKAVALADTTLQGNANALQTAKQEYQARRDALTKQINDFTARQTGLQQEADALQAQLETETDEAKRAQLQAALTQKLADAQTAATQVQQARAELDAATKAFSEEEGRVTNQLVNEGQGKTFSEKEHALQKQALQIEIDSAKQALEEINALRKDPVLYAQQSGTVLETAAKPGDTLTPASVVVTLGTGGGCSMEVQVPQSDIAKIKLGQTAQITLEAYPDTPFTGTVEQINLKGETANSDVTYKVYIRLQGDTQAVFDGMTGEVNFILKQKTNLLLLSNKAIQNQNGTQTVLRRKPDGSVETVAVQTGFSDGRVSEITGGLAENDVILVER